MSHCSCGKSMTGRGREKESSLILLVSGASVDGRSWRIRMKAELCSGHWAPSFRIEGS